MGTLPSIEDLFDSILKARQRVYELAPATELVRFEGGAHSASQLFIKREDLSPIHAYKWRGAYNKMAQLSPSEIARGVVCASAGNHAQGVAVSACRIGTHATIFMPKSTPQMKVAAVRELGGDAVQVRIEGNSYDDAFELAQCLCQKENKTFIHAYDDLEVIAGQGTIADEVVMAGIGTLNRAYLQIGGGGMAAGVACWLKRYYPDIEIVGVEGKDQASMAKAVEAGKVIALDYLDVFCDGTAVKQTGTLTLHFCRQLVDRFITVTNEEVCAAIQKLWETHRLIPEPAGAMGLAGYLKEASQSNLTGANLAIICGANMDFGQLAWVVKRAGIGSARRKFYRFFLEEKPGTLLRLLRHFPNEVNIVEFQHGLSSGEKVAPVIGIDATPEQITLLEKELNRLNVPFEDATQDEDVEFRIIHYDAQLFQRPLFVRIEFHERPGALSEFLESSCRDASIIYFNYGYTGERVGRALIGFDFADDSLREEFVDQVFHRPNSLRHASELSYDAFQRVVS